MTERWYDVGSWQAMGSGAFLIPESHVHTVAGEAPALSSEAETPTAVACQPRYSEQAFCYSGGKT
jgi:hypothetical protein